MAPRKARPEEPRSIKSAQRVFDILEYVRARPDGAGFMDITRALDIPKSSLFGLLELMAARHYLEFDAEHRRYTLGVRTLELGQAYLGRHDALDVSRQEMAALVADVNETAQLARLVGAENVYLARVDSSHALRLQSETGARLPAHATGVGKALLAELPDDDLATLFPEETLAVFTPNTWPTRAALCDELARIRQRGFAIDNQEHTPGVFCLAVAVKGHGGAAPTSLSVSVPLARASRQALAAVLARLAAASLAISQRTGAPADPLLLGLSAPEQAAAEIDALIRAPQYRLPFD